jgi:hypothetical protein
MSERALSKRRVLGELLAHFVELLASFAVALGVILTICGFLSTSDRHGGMYLIVSGVTVAGLAAFVWLGAYLVRRWLERSRA